VGDAGVDLALADFSEWFFLITASILFYLGVTYSYEAYRNSDLSVVAPFRYWYLVVAIVAGLVAFGEVPGVPSILGMIVIVGAGGIVLWQQRPVPNADGSDPWLVTRRTIAAFSP
jgi:drug/metabolite transporter (DMT)-like permease